MSKLNTTVFLVGPDGQGHFFGPDSEIPAWAEKAINTPGVWDEPPTGDTPDTDTGAGEGDGGDGGGGQTDGAGGGQADGAGDGQTDGAGGSDGDEPPLVIPPLVGHGSDTAAWRTYATEAVRRAGLQIEFAEDAKRTDIVAALADANIPTKAPKAE